jgi:hypothetical protein
MVQQAGPVVAVAVILGLPVAQHHQQDRVMLVAALPDTQRRITAAAAVERALLALLAVPALVLAVQVQLHPYRVQV